MSQIVETRPVDPGDDPETDVRELSAELDGLDDARVVSGSGTIARWAYEHPLARAKSSA